MKRILLILTLLTIALYSFSQGLNTNLSINSKYNITSDQYIKNLSHTSATSGTKISFEAEHRDGYEISYYMIGDIKVTTSNYSCSFIMPSIDVYIQAYYIASTQNKTTSNNSTTTYTFTVNGVSFDMILVEHGSFKMGNSDGYSGEKPVHIVNLTNDYYLGKFEVTQKLWKAVVDTLPSVMNNLKSNFFGDDKPVVAVSWYDAKKFINKLNKLTNQNFRLPTEAEWEYAARGGNKSKGYIYSGSNNIKEVAWYGWQKSNKHPHPVGQKMPNEIDIYDMTGNVWEWCEDTWYDYTNSLETNPIHNDGVVNIRRGGSWNRDAEFCHVAWRGYDKPFRCYVSIGFRLAL
ncbi:MAG: formylglycine-generating enzyme family protein [Bacteroidales bacterium]|nr:formylglycine-generating enzyme family protein [Bacteroidales bacterium]